MACFDAVMSGGPGPAGSRAESLQGRGDDTKKTRTAPLHRCFFWDRDVDVDEYSVEILVTVVYACKIIHVAGLKHV